MLPQKRAGEPAPIRAGAACSCRGALQQSVQYDALHTREPAADAGILNRGESEACDAAVACLVSEPASENQSKGKPAKNLLRLMRCRCQRHDRAVSAL